MLRRITSFGRLRMLLTSFVAVLAAVFSLVFTALPASAAVLQLSSDPFTQATCAASNTTNHHTEVEPDTFSFGSTIVTVFQVGRIFDGGACAIGFATSTNNGSTWTNGLLPSITTHTTPAGIYPRATDPSIAFDAKHGVWVASTLGLTETGGVKGVAVLASTSTDGVTWGAPFTVSTASVSPDKNWIVCDDTTSSPFYGNCYTEWDDNGQGNLLQMSTSSNGGQTWGPVKTNNAGVIGGQPVVRPDGTVIVPIDNANETALGAFDSTDGGNTWSFPVTITTISHKAAQGSLREGPLPSAEIDGNGTVYIAWADCRFRRHCASNDIVLTHSLNATGTSWSAVSRVPIDATNSGINHVIPGLAVNKSTSGSSAQLGLTYYFFASGSSSLQVGFISSGNAGSTWGTPQTVFGGASAFPTTWVATTSQGRMVGDYISTSYGSDNLAHGVFETATAPSSGTSCSSPLDNCNEPTDTFAAGLSSGSLSSAGDPVLFGGNNGNAASLWNVVDNNGSKHRD